MEGTMNETFVTIATGICLLVGLGFCWLPVNRYRKAVAVGGFGTLLIVLGVTLMTTYKWTEVAIKISDLEFKLAEAQAETTKFKLALADVQKGSTEQAKSKAFETILINYKELAKSEPTPSDIQYFKEAVAASDVTFLPAQSLEKAQELRWDSMDK
jgi:hypothetical protein